MMAGYSDYVVYVDESGDHGLATMDPSYPVFVLAFCIFEKSDYAQRVTPSVQQFKFKHFGHDMVVMHEHEIRKATGPFQFLFDRARREEFMAGLNQIVSSAKFTLIATAIRKDWMKAGEREELRNPYHIALKCGLERVHTFLQSRRQGDRVTHVIVESRGRREDDELELEFRRVCDGENLHRARLPLKVVFASKQINSCGLQLADLVARPIGRKILIPDQANRAYDLLEPKFDRGPEGQIEGWGLRGGQKTLVF